MTRTASRAGKAVETVDFKARYPELYRASAKVTEVKAAQGTFLAFDGVGAPGGEAFQQGIDLLFTLAYTAKFAFKRAGAGDFAISALECLYFHEAPDTPKDEWRWRLLVRIPDEVKAGALAEVRRAIKEKKGVDTRAVKRVTWAEGRALQVLHVGPYDQVGDAFKQIGIEAAARTLMCRGIAHEIYLNDPRRIAPEKLRTIVRLPMRPA
jgi:hypothetical protein